MAPSVLRLYISTYSQSQTLPCLSARHCGIHIVFCLLCPFAVMRCLALLAAVVAAVSAGSVLQHHQLDIQAQDEISNQEQFLIELSPGETRWITEDEKWELRRVKQPSTLRNSWTDIDRMVSTSWTLPRLDIPIHNYLQLNVQP